MPATPIFIGKIYFDGLGAGWSESHWLSASTAATAKTALAALIALRLPMLSDQFSLTYANVSQLGVARDSYLVGTPGTLGSSSVTTWVSNRVNDALLIRCETAEGKFANKFIHGIPDVVANSDEYLTDGGAFNTALVAYLAGLITHTGFKKKVPDSNPVTYTIEAFTSTVNRGLTTHKVGRPFGASRGRARTQ